MIERGSRNVPGRAEGLHVGWGTVVEGFVQALVAEPRDVFDDRELELRAGAPDAV